jgi:DNA-binding SARP family transcriptional activator
VTPASHTRGGSAAGVVEQGRAPPAEHAGKFAENTWGGAAQSGDVASFCPLTWVVSVVEVNVSYESWSLQLLGGFELCGPEGPVEVAPGVQRLLAYIALQGGAVTRARAARELWPEVPCEQASANLRSTLWRARRLGPLVSPGASTLRLDPCVDADVGRLTARLLSRDARRRGGQGTTDGYEEGDGSPLWSGFNLELLPDWSEDWVMLERERLRHLELQFLDDEVAALVDRGRVTEALDTVLRAIRLEPLRESSHQALIRIFVQSGNRSAALTHYHGLVDLLRDELDLGPDPVTTALVQPFLSPRRRPARPWRPASGVRAGVASRVRRHR